MWSEIGVSVLQNLQACFGLQFWTRHLHISKDVEKAKLVGNVQFAGQRKAHNLSFAHLVTCHLVERSETSDLGPAGFRRVNERLHRSLCPAHLGPSTCAARSPVEVKTNKTDMGSG